MNSLTRAAVAFIACIAAAPAFAADLPMPTKAPPAPAPVGWTGWYAGLNAGGSFGTANNTGSVGGVPSQPINQNLNGFIGGGQIGYNWQSGYWVFGLEADFQGSSERASATGLETIPGVGVILGPFPLTLTDRLDWFGTVRGRIGVAPSPNWLVYATGGLAYGEVDTSSSLNVGGVVATNNFNVTRVGWTIGGGVEWRFDNKWSVKVEYLYIDLGSFSNTFTGVGPAFTPVVIGTHVTDNIARAGVNYHF